MCSDIYSFPEQPCSQCLSEPKLWEEKQRPGRRPKAREPQHICWGRGARTPSDLLGERQSQHCICWSRSKVRDCRLQSCVLQGCSVPNPSGTVGLHNTCSGFPKTRRLVCVYAVLKPQFFQRKTGFVKEPGACQLWERTRNTAY